MADTNIFIFAMIFILYAFLMSVKASLVHRFVCLFFCRYWTRNWRNVSIWWSAPWTRPGRFSLTNPSRDLESHARTCSQRLVCNVILKTICVHEDVKTPEGFVYRYSAILILNFHNKEIYPFLMFYNNFHFISLYLFKKATSVFLFHFA